METIALIHPDFANRFFCKQVGTHRKAHIYTDQNGRFGFTFCHDIGGGIILEYRTLGATKAAINNMTQPTRVSAKQAAINAAHKRNLASFGIFI